MTKLTKDKLIRAFWDEYGRDIDTECTCNDCPDKDNCKYAFDLYNTDGDCLASK